MANDKDSPPGTPSESPETELTQLKRKWAVRTPSDLRQRSAEVGSAHYLIEGLLPVRGLGILIGDSGFGKSPLMYQAALCIAAGVPFLGREVQQGRVLYLDFENSVGQSAEIVSRLARHLGVNQEQENFLVWNLCDCSPYWNARGYTALDMIREVKPALAIIDSLASYDPELEEKNSNAGKAYRDFRKLSREVGSGIVGIHHPKKASNLPGRDSPEPLETANLHRWFDRARGASALIKGCDVRLALDEPSARERKLSGDQVDIDPSSHVEDKSALVMRGFGRVRGEIPLTYIARVFDADDAEPLGYRPLAGVDLLFNEEQEIAYGQLPESIPFKMAKQIYRKGDQATRDFLLKCIRTAGIMRQTGKGQYAKVHGAE